MSGKSFYKEDKTVQAGFLCQISEREVYNSSYSFSAFHLLVNTDQIRFLEEVEFAGKKNIILEIERDLTNLLVDQIDDGQFMRLRQSN